MAAPEPSTARPERLRLTPRSVLVAVAMFGLTVSLLGLLAASRRVIGWILVAAVVAGLVHPLVTYLERRMRRGFAVLLVMAGLLGAAAVVVWGLVDDVADETRRLQEAAPARARQLEQSDRVGDLATNLRLEERTRRFVDEVPDRLRGGTPAEALLAAGTRGVAFLATSVLTVFFLLHGPRLSRATLAQVQDPRRREAVHAVVLAVYRRAFGYAGARLAMAVAAGLFAYVVARLADVPGPAPLAFWVGLWDLVPLAGTVVGALPVVGLAAAASGPKAAWVAAAFVAYQLVENAFVERPVEQATVRTGPFLTLAAGIIGLELSGVAGALLCVLAAVGLVAAADELATP